MRGHALAVLLLGTLPVSGEAGGAGEDGEVLLPGRTRERAIAVGEVHAWRAEAGGAPLLLRVEQQGIDVVVAARRPGEEEVALTTDAPNGRWGAELLLLPAGGGEHRIEVKPAQRPGPAGRYTASLEPLPPDPESVWHRAAAAMSRAGQAVAAGTAEALAAAAAAYAEAQEGWRALGERHLEAEATHCLAAVERQRGDLRAAAQGYAAALDLWRQLGDGQREALALNRLGRVHLDGGNVEEARGAFAGALELLRRLDDRFGEGEVRGNLCLVEQTRGALPEALACYQETQALFHALGDRAQEALLLNNLGGVYDLRGEPDAALSHYARALELRRELGDRPGEAQTLNNVAAVHRAVGDWQEALRVYGQAREILSTLGDRQQEAVLLNNVGYAYASLGEPQRALAFFADALALRRATGDRRGEVITLNNLGLARRSLGELDAALAAHRQALAVATALGDGRQRATTAVRLAEVHLERSDPEAALGELAPALAHLGETGNRRGAAAALHLRGRALSLAGRPLDALPVLAAALEERRALRDRAGEAETLHVLAAAERALGRAEAARAHAREAVERVEAMRTGVVSPDLRAAFLATRRRAYELLIDLLMDRHAADPAGGHDREALAVSERARARTLLDALEGLDAAGPGGTVPAGRALRRRLSATVDRQLRQSGAAAEALSREIDALLAELDGVEAEARRRDPRYAAFSDPPAAAAHEIAGLLEDGTLLLEYALGEERSFLWAVGGGAAVRSFVLPPGREIEALARRVHEDLKTVEAGARGGSADDAAAALAKVLLSPVWSEAARARRLAVVPDAALHLVPFSALPVPEPGRAWDAGGARLPLLERHEVVYLPSAATLAVSRRRLAGRPPAPKRAAVLADPVFTAGDPRLAATGGGGQASVAAAASRDAETERGDRRIGETGVAFERLPASGEEAAAIAALAPPGEVWTALGPAASRELALSEALRAYRVVHFATHGVADAGNPERSGLVLSLLDAAGDPREGFLGLADVYELDLAADLVVLSGCRTAVGREVRGEGLMGLTRGFLYAGVPRVVASLWRVQDRTTAELMTRFYRALWQDGLPPAAALRQAQRSLRGEPRYRDPYSWAGFVLQGEWR